MSSCFSTTTVDHSEGTQITDVHSDIIQTHILNRLDGPTLASTSCASSQLHIICTEESLWKNISNSNWPSTKDARVQEIISTFPSGHRSFYSDSYPTVRRLHHKQRLHLGHRSKSRHTQQESMQTTELISAIDIHYGNEMIYSKVVVTETSRDWFMYSPLRVELLDTKEIVPTPVKFDGEEETCMARMEKNMRLSWILIDPVKKRAVNLSSLRPVEVRRHWLTGEVLVLYATVMAAGDCGGFVKCEVDVLCGGKEGALHLWGIGMQVEDIEGTILSGKDSLGILQYAMEDKRVNGKMGVEKKMYKTFLVWKEFYLSSSFIPNCSCLY